MGCSGTNNVDLAPELTAEHIQRVSNLVANALSDIETTDQNSPPSGRKFDQYASARNLGLAFSFERLNYIA